MGNQISREIGSTTCHIEVLEQWALVQQSVMLSIILQLSATTTPHLPQAPANAAYSSNPTQVPDWFSDNNFDVDHH